MGHTSAWCAPPPKACSPTLALVHNQNQDPLVWAAMQQAAAQPHDLKTRGSECLADHSHAANISATAFHDWAIAALTTMSRDNDNSADSSSHPSAKMARANDADTRGTYFH